MLSIENISSINPGALDDGFCLSNRGKMSKERNDVCGSSKTALHTVATFNEFFMRLKVSYMWWLCGCQR